MCRPSTTWRKSRQAPGPHGTVPGVRRHARLPVCVSVVTSASAGSPRWAPAYGDPRFRCRRWVVNAISPFRGREAEMAAVDAMLDTLVRGGSGLLLLDGEPGIGKSRIVSEAHAGARRRSMVAAPGRADEVAAVAPLTPLLAALAGGEPPVVHRAEVRALERPGDQRFWLLEELAEILEVRSRDQ